MADRTEIDALLISALYGELTPADEARLTAHLESHPADRTALADLTHTRATFRDSRILTVQLEPPQSVSALLLQEAARRAPKREVAGWFHRFTRSFMLHPAMAAAAMLVLIVGVAGTLYVRNGDQFSGATAPEAARNMEAPVAAAAPEPETGTGRLADTQNGVPSDRSGAAAGSGAYRVGLDEPAAPKPALPEPAPPNDQAGPVGRAKGEKNLVADGEASAAKEAGRGQAQQLALEQPTKPSVSPPAAKLAKKGSSAGRGIELRSPEMAPKDFDDDKTESYAKKDVAKRELGNANADVDRAGTTVADTLAQAPGAAPSAGGATAVPSMMPQQNYAAAPPPAADPAAAAPSTPSNRSSDMAKLKAPAKTVSREAVAQKPAPAPPPAPPPPAATVAAEPPSAPRDSRRLADKRTVSPADAKLAEDKTSEDKTAEDKVLAEWVQKQREQVLAYVKSNNCRAAANVAVAIYNRAPDYYAANIATDRSIKPCIAYVNNEREREDRSRAAAKRANAADAPAAAPPTRK